MESLDGVGVRSGADPVRNYVLAIASGSPFPRNRSVFDLLEVCDGFGMAQSVVVVAILKFFWSPVSLLWFRRVAQVVRNLRGSRSARPLRYGQYLAPKNATDGPNSVVWN